MVTSNNYSYTGASLSLTRRQQRLVDLIDQRSRYGIPTVQRDLAEALGIRRDSLNKLLARTRHLLAARGIRLQMPPRRRETCVKMLSLLSAGAE